ncbi:MAG: hypothetical protein EOO56_11125 [Hymenobacter sp.]|nr:MAG: hypothetical protein EOO56_11125 [Hymenobacter sp.]
MKKRAFRWSLWLGMVLLLASACQSRTRRYGAFENVGVGSYTVNLYTNGECAVEMGLGYHEGRYTQQGDILRLIYQEGLLPGLPTRLLLTPHYLVTLPSPQYPRSTRIRRQ